MTEAVSLECLLRNTPQEKLDWQVSSSDLSKIARRLSKWRLLAPHLHITPEQEKEIVRDYPSDLQLQSLKCLQRWSIDHDSEATYGTLMNAIFEIANADLIDNICSLLSAQSCPSAPHDRTVHNYADVLRHSYSRLSLPNIFETLSGDDEEAPSPAQCYINLVMTSREKIQRGRVDKEHQALAQQGDTSEMINHMSKQGQKVPIAVQDIFELDNGTCKVILIEGAPGSGKTTLFRYITRQWANGELFQSFNLVLLIQLRDKEVHEAKGLMDLLPFVYNQSEREQITKKCYKTKGERVLILFDGWDELPIEKQKKSIFLEVLKCPEKYSLSKAAVLVSARPITSVSIQQFATTRIEILGFTPEQIDMYVTKSLPEREAKKLTAAIREDPILQGNCYLPLSIAIITHTYITMGHELPATFCRIIMELALSCLYRYINKCTPYGYLYVTLNTFDDLQKAERTQFDTLCEMAYTSLTQQKYSFDDPNMPTLGLMQSVESFVARGKGMQHYFLHMSLHELCAAQYLASMQLNEQLAVLPTHLEFEMKNLLGFFSALGGWKEKGAKVVLVSHARECLREMHSESHCGIYEDKCKKKSQHLGYKSTVYPILSLLHYVHETQDATICESLPSVLEIHHFPLSSNDVAAMRFILIHRKIEQFLIINNYLTANHLRLLEPGLKSNLPDQVLFSCPNIGDEGIKIITTVIKGEHLRTLNLNKTGMTEIGAECLGNVLQYCPVLRHLSISYNAIGSTGLMHITNNLQNTAIVYFEFSECNIEDLGMIEFSSVLPKTRIIEISIGGNNVSSRGLEALADAIMKRTNFWMVNFIARLPSTAFSGRVVRQFLKWLLNHTTFSRITTNGCTFDIEFKKFAEDFNKKREELGLCKVIIEHLNIDTFETKYERARPY